jgi:hypothetical protein
MCVCVKRSEKEKKVDGDSASTGRSSIGERLLVIANGFQGHDLTPYYSRRDVVGQYERTPSYGYSIFYTKYLFV